MSNIERFSMNVVKIAAALYNSHPRPMMLSFKTLSIDQEDHSAVADVSGAIEWLNRNHLISGSITRMGDAVIISGAQLTASAYRILTMPERNADDAPLGQFATTLAEADDEVDPELTAIVVQRLLGS